MAEAIDTCGLYDLAASSGDEKSSLLYSVLPKIVRTRIRRLPSLRRSISQYALESESTSSASSSRRTSRLYSDLGTPPPGYQSRMSLSEPVSDAEGDDELPIRPLSACSSEGPVENDSGILWKFANQGLSLLNIAASEDKKASRNSPNTPTSLSRQLYVHGVTYMLRGLPKDLSADERLGIWSSIPPEIQQVAPVTNTAVVIQQQTGPYQPAGTPPKPSALQQAIAGLIVQLFVITQFLLPYIKYCFAVLYKYERQHRISERVIASSVQTCEGMMKTGLQVTNAICRMNDGKVGQALNEMSVWWVTGVTAGIHQGVGDGLTLLGAKNDAIAVGGESKKTQ